MSTALPPRLEEALSSWPLWRPAPSRKPEVTGHLDAGLTNDAWLVDAGGKQVVVRLNSPFGREFNIDRVRELYIHRAVSELGYAPPILYCNIDAGYLVSEFIAGDVWGDEDLHNANNQYNLLCAMTRLQKIPLPFAKFDYWRHLCHYESCLIRLGVEMARDLRARKARMAEAIQAFQNGGWKPCLVHHDLSAGNIIAREGQLFILDWEYAACGYQGMDFPAFDEGLSEPSVVADLSALINEYWLLLKEQLLETA